MKIPEKISSFPGRMVGIQEKRIILSLDSVVRFENESVECAIKRKARDVFRTIYADGSIEGSGVVLIDDVRKEVCVLIHWFPLEKR